MGRIIKNKPVIKIEEPKKIEVENIPQGPAEPVIAMNEFLSNYSAKRGLDTVFINWFRKKDPSNPMKTVAEWYKLIDEFLNEVA